MLLAGRSFDHVCDIEPRRGADGSLFLFTPPKRYRTAHGLLSQHKFGEGPFCTFRIPAQRASGVYALLVDGKLRYVGECRNLATRFNVGYGRIYPRNCFRGGRQTNCRVNALLYREIRLGHRVSLWFHKTRDHKGMEKDMRTALRPPWNRT